MTENGVWRELYRNDDATHIRGIAATIASMHFDVRCRHRDGPWRGIGDTDPGSPPHAIDVSESDWAVLKETLGDIIAEQAAFDERFARPQRWSKRVQQQITLLMIVVVMVLAIFGLIEL